LSRLVGLDTAINIGSNLPVMLISQLLRCCGG